MTGCIFKRKLKSGPITWGYSIDDGKDENGNSALTLECVFNRLKDAGGWSRKAKVARPLSAKTVRQSASRRVDDGAGTKQSRSCRGRATVTGWASGRGRACGALAD